MNNMSKEETKEINELNMTIKSLNDRLDCISRQRDSVIDQSQILKNERDSMIERNRELHRHLKIVQEKLEKYEKPKSLDEAMKNEMLKYGHVFLNN